MNGKRFGVICATALLVLVLGVPTSATAKRKAITGELTEPGLTVIALAASGKARTDRAPDGTFALRPPAQEVTLHLRARNGSYAGPIVVGGREHGKRAIVGLEAGAKLGKVEFSAEGGYAKVSKSLPKRAVDDQRQARAKNGIPIGAGNFGRVRSKPPRDSVVGDTDFDGIPDTLDIDDDGDLILDDYDRRSTKASTSTVPYAVDCCPGETFEDGSHLWAGTILQAKAAQAVNVNGGSTDEQIAAAQRSLGLLNVSYIGIDPGSGELDCAALVYCSVGGTGRAATGNPFAPRESSPSFPECCDPDGDGFGKLTGNGETQSLWHGATADQIRAGDVLIMRSTINDAQSQSVTTVGYVFATLPVIATYDDGQGNAGAFTYPLTGTLEYPISGPPAPVRAGPNGDVVLELSVWRPQRRRIAGESGDSEWMDVGGLTYAVAVPSAGPGFCPQSSFSTTDPDLTPVPSSTLPGGAGGFNDRAGDQPQSASNTLTYTLNLTRCLESSGGSLAPNDTVNVVTWAFATSHAGGFANSAVSFVRLP
jgi:hypothetical protein